MHMQPEHSIKHVVIEGMLQEAYVDITNRKAPQELWSQQKKAMVKLQMEERPEDFSYRKPPVSTRSPSRSRQTQQRSPKRSPSVGVASRQAMSVRKTPRVESTSKSTEAGNLHSWVDNGKVDWFPTGIEKLDYEPQNETNEFYESLVAGRSDKHNFVTWILGRPEDSKNRKVRVNGKFNPKTTEVQAPVSYTHLTLPTNREV